MSAVNNKENLLNNIYIYAYVVFAFATVFIDSEIQTVSVGHLITLMYEFIEIIFIVINLIFIIKSNNTFKLLLSLIIISVMVLSNLLFHGQIISPFFANIYLMIINSNMFSNCFHFIKADLYSKVAAILLVFFCSIIHLFPNIIIVRNGTVPRYSFGFNSPNTPDLMILSLIFSVILLSIFYKKKKKLYTYITILLLIIVYFIVLKYTNSNECLIAILLLLGLLIINLIPVIKNILLGLPIFAYLASIFISIYFTFFCRSSMFSRIDELTTNRLSGWVMAFSIYPVQLLGRSNLDLLGDYHPTIMGAGFMNREFAVASLDNGYLSNMMRIGILGLVILSIFILYVLCKIKISKNDLLCIFSIVVLITFLSVQCKIFYTLFPMALIICNNKKEYTRENKEITKYDNI